MKLMIDIRKLSNKPSGIGMYIYNYVKGLLKEEIELIAVTDIQISEEIKELKSLNLRIIEYGKEVNNNFEVFKYFKFIETILDKESPDYFWEPNFIIPINIKKQFKNIAFIITIFDLIPILNPEVCSLKYRMYFKYFLKKTIKNADYVLYISDTVKRQCEYVYPFIKNKKSLMNYVIIEDRYDTNKEDLTDLDYFLFIGNIEERKGIRILIDAYKLYLNNGGTKKLKLVGSIKDKKIEEMLDNEINLNSGMIEYLGYVDENKKMNLIKNSSCLIFPSYAEGFGMPPLEAIMLGKPVIVSDIEIFREVLDKNANYFNISNDFDKSVINLYNTMCSYKNINSNQAEKLMKKYDSEILSKRLIDFLGDLK